MVVSEVVNGIVRRVQMGREVGIRARLLHGFSLLPVLSVREIRSRYRHSVLDVLWSLLTPILVLVVYGLVLTRSFAVESACGPYLSSAWVGLVVWSFFAAALGNGVSSLVAASDLITKVYFPREAIPLSSVGASLLDLGVGAVTIVVLLPIQGIRPTWMWAWSLVAVVMIVVWSAALTVAAAALAVFARDTVHAVHLALRIGFFATPVVYESQLLPDAFAWSAKWNPVAVAIDVLRAALLCGQRPDLRLLAIHTVAGALLFVGSILFVRRVEAQLVDAS